MDHKSISCWQHSYISRRTAVQAGAMGVLGLGSNHLSALRAADSGQIAAGGGTAKTCIYIFLSGGLSQHESFDLKPNAPDGIRGEFKPISTATPGTQICEHLPELAKRSNHWGVVRSLTHPTNSHTRGHFFMLTGRSTTPTGYKGDRQPRPTDWPSIMSVAGDVVPAPRNNLPPAIVLPERLVHWSGGVIPGAYGGQMGSHRDPFFIEASPYGNPLWRGAYPEYTFPNTTNKPPEQPDARVYQAPNLQFAPGLTRNRLNGRLGLLQTIDEQRRRMEDSAVVQSYDRERQNAISMLASPRIRNAFDVTNADPKIQERYGANSFGWSLLMAYRLTAAGVPLVQINLGNNETWDTHGNSFYRFREKLFPPTDRAISALLDDLQSSGLLDTTMIVMAGEFGRTPKLEYMRESYPGPGRGHWGSVQSVFFAGGAIRGGTVVGSSDATGGYPATNPKTPENMAATLYHALGIPHTAVWNDDVGRPHQVYHGEPIHELLG
ncbi:MAG: DUF1501 domain-containing protein [Fuerstiella sp.]|nr:DUF1501 domain-containing protein [Fuerstiella sp.]